MWAGNLIRLVRLERNLSQRDLARMAATSQAAIAAYETGKRSPTLDTLARIVRAAGLDLRIRLEKYDDYDEWIARYQATLPREVIEARRKRDRELLSTAGEEKKRGGVARRTLSFPDSIEDLVRENAREGESFSTTAARLIQQGARTRGLNSLDTSHPGPVRATSGAWPTSTCANSSPRVENRRGPPASANAASLALRKCLLDGFSALLLLIYHKGIIQKVIRIGSRMAETLGVAEAKRRFSELIERVGHGERFLVSRRGKPAVALVPPNQAGGTRGPSKPLGLLTVAGALSDWGEPEMTS